MTLAIPDAVRWISAGSCPVCGFAELRRDEAVDGAVWQLVECPRCEHRSTVREPLVAARAEGSRRRAWRSGDRAA